MKALIRKDLDWLVIFFLLGMVFPLALSWETSFERNWIYGGGNTCEILHFIWSLSGFILGIFASLREEITRTEEFLRQRPVSPARILSAKIIGCMGVMGAWLLLTLIFLMLPGLWSDNAVIAAWSRISVYVLIGTPVFSGFAVGFFAGSLRLFWIKRVLIGATGFLSLLSLSQMFAGLAGLLGKEIVSPIYAYGSLHLVTASLLIWACYRNFQQIHDPDRPFSRRTLHVSGTTAVVIMTVFLGICLLLRQSGLHGKLLAEYPGVMEFEKNDIRLVKNTWTGGSQERTLLEVNERHEPIRTLPWPKEKSGRYSPRGLWSLRSSASIEDVFNFRSPVRYFLGDLSFAYSLDQGTYISNPREGYFYFLRLSYPEYPLEPSVRKLGKGREHRPFSRSARMHFLCLKPGVVMVGDPSDGTVWYCDIRKEEPLFLSLSLPNGDSFIEWYYVDLDHVRDIVEELDFELPYYVNTYFTAVGRKSAYLWNGSEFTEASAETKKYIETKQVPAVQVKETDPIRIPIELKDDGGEVCFSHVYDLYTGKQKRLVAELCGYSFIRIPCLQWLSYLGTTTPRLTFKGSLIIDPLLASGKRFWLLAGNLAVAALLAFWAVRRLGRLGADRGRKIYWGILTVLGGLPVFIVYRLLETKRAYRVSEIVREEDAPPMRIHTKIEAAAAAPQSKTT